MHDKHLDRRMPFELNRQALEDLNNILERAKRAVDDLIGGSEPQTVSNTFTPSSERGANIRYTIDCSDYTSNRQLELQQLITYPNYRDAQIISVTAEVWAKYGYRAISIELRSRTEFDNIRCKITGEEDFINTFTIQLNAWLNSICKSYWWLYKTGLIGGFLIFYAFFSLVMFGWATWYITIDGAKDLGAVFVASFLGSWIVYPVSIYLRKFAFPLGEFAVGRGIDRQRRREHLLYTLIGVMLVGGVIVELLTTFISSRLF
jgi:hypothetical protein